MSQNNNNGRRRQRSDSPNGFGAPPPPPRPGGRAGNLPVPGAQPEGGNQDRRLAARLSNLQRRRLSVRRANGTLATYRNWVVTFWGTRDELLASITDPTDPTELRHIGDTALDYIIGQLERAPNFDPTNRHQGLHWQLYLEFNRPLSFQQVLDFLGWNRRDVDGSPLFHIHIEPAWGRQDQCIFYVTKEESRVPAPAAGAPPTTLELGRRHPPDAVGRQAAFVAAVQNGTPWATLMREHPTYIVQCFNNASKFFQQSALLDAPQFRPVQVTLLWGPPGTGKTRYVFENHPDVYNKLDGRFWDGYTGQDVVLFDEFRGQTELTLFLKWLDGHKLILDIKGTFGPALYTKVYICTNTPYEKWYPNESPDLLAALDRRIPVRSRYHVTSPAALPPPVASVESPPTEPGDISSPASTTSLTSYIQDCWENAENNVFTNEEMNQQMTELLTPIELEEDL